MKCEERFRFAHAFFTLNRRQDTGSMRTVAPTFLVTLVLSLAAAHAAHAEIAWEKNLRSAHAKAQAEGKLLLLHFYSDNCTWCDRLEAGAFQATEVSDTISENFVPVKVHANSSPKLAQMFKVTKFPTDVIVTTEGKTLSHSVSPQKAERYIEMLSSSVLTAAAAKVAKKPEEDVDPKPTSRAAVEAKPPAVGGSIPDYAAGPSAAPIAKSDASTAAKPASRGLSTGVQARLAGARTPGSTFTMPEDTEVQSASTPSTLEMPEFDTSEPATRTAPTSNATDSAITLPSDATSLPTSSSQAASTPEEQALPAAEAELAMQGFCPVSVITEDKWIEGKAEYGVIHLGKLYLFVNEQAMKTFLADPVPFTPVLNEIDVVRFFEERKIVPGKREWGLKDPVYNRMFFFADEAAMNHFYNEYERYTDAAIEVMDKAVKDANPGT